VAESQADATLKEPWRIARMFNAIAPRYDLLNHVLSAGLDVHWRTLAIRSLGLRGGETVLDLCTGTGDLALGAAAATPGARRVLGLDVARGMLDLAVAKVGRRHLSRRVQMVQADATRIPVASSTIDAATVAFGIRNVETPDRAYAEVLRVLKPGGRFAVLEFSLPERAVIGPAYLWYFRYVVPRVGRLLSGHSVAYAYLPASVESFPEPAEAVRGLEASGFHSVRAVRLTLGIVYLYTARKPDSHHGLQTASRDR
jgi:demethylmenaquinone methyltransferase/2-methoxy-6-polyprenyl-1,4-benzoquinol methylase